MKRMSLHKNLHPENLERLSIAALWAGELDAAFMYADRRCRIAPLAKAYHYTLRAEALSRLGERDSAILDVAKALELAPEDIQANRRMLDWDQGSRRTAAARMLVRMDTNSQVLVRALRVLRENNCCATGSIRVLEDVIEGWAAWSGSDDAVLTIRTDMLESTTTFAAGEYCALDGCGFDNIASFCLSRPKCSTTQVVNLSSAGQVFCSVIASPNTKAECIIDQESNKDQSREAGITVIVPIYRDLSVTRDCLEGLKPQISQDELRHMILVNDATPEPALRKYIRSLSKYPRVTVLENDINIGFVGSINRALRRVNGGDVVLLNADTILPTGFVERLAAVASSDSAIGTVTPLSNNGEFTSFPVGFESNPLPSMEMVSAIDKIAAWVNRDRVVNIPNGIGFCLYVTRRCLDAVGLLSENFHRGYLEDVDFCLRARQHGFRNVCATSIYVGHHGSRSFRTDKRALVVRNLETLETNFPEYRRECAVYMLADPLRLAREAIERVMPVSIAYDRLIVSGPGIVKSVAVERGDTLLRAKKPVLFLIVDHDSDSIFVRVQDAGRAAPQSLTFRFNKSGGYRDLQDYLKSLRFKRIEIADPARLPTNLVKLLFNLDKPIDLLVVDGGLVCPRGTLTQANGDFCRTLGSETLCGSCASTCFSSRQVTPRAEDWRAYWAGVANDADRVLAPCRQAKAFISNFLPNHLISVIASSDRLEYKNAGGADMSSTHVGIVPYGQTIEEFRLMQTLLRLFVQRSADTAFVVIGTTFDDLALMATGNVFVSGSVRKTDYATVFGHYKLKKVFLATHQPLFGHPALAEAHRSGLPVAYFDWSFGQCKSRKIDLAIDPRLHSRQIASAILRWAAGGS